jgi:hypothetical protein
MKTNENCLDSCMPKENIISLQNVTTVEGLDWDLIDLHTACPLK